MAGLIIGAIWLVLACVNAYLIGRHFEWDEPGETGAAVIMAALFAPLVIFILIIALLYRLGDKHARGR